MALGKKAALAKSRTIPVRLSCPGSEPGGCRGTLSLATLGKRKAQLGSASLGIAAAKAQPV